MKLTEAIQFIKTAIPKQQGVWADIGAGTGIFTKALDHLLPRGSTIYAIDNDPKTLFSIKLENCELHIKNHDFNQPFSLPQLDGILLANALHYSANPKATLKNILNTLRPGGIFILIEYELNHPRNPWIPYPITFKKFQNLALQIGLSKPEELAQIPSTYGNNYMYLAKARKV